MVRWGSAREVDDVRQPVRVGLVGAGPWAQLVHAPLLAHSRHTSLAGVWARRPEAAASLARQHGTSAVDSVEALFDRCDAVAFAVPPAVQAELAVGAVGAGRAVLLEKPIAADLVGAERLAEATQQAGVGSLVLLTWRYTDAVRRFLRTAPGISPRTGRCRFVSDSMLGGPFATPWRLERGPLLDLGPHVIDLLDAALGPVEAVHARGDRHGTVNLTLDHQGGGQSQATLCATAVGAVAEAGATIEGEGGRLEIDCAAAVGPATFATVAEELAATVHGTPSADAPDVQRGLHVQRIIHSADVQLA